MALEINFYSILKMELDTPQIELELDDEINIKQLIEKLDKKYDNIFTKKLLSDSGSEIDRGTIILVNGHNVLHLDGLDTKVGNSDKIAVFPPSGGG